MQQEERLTLPALTVSEILLGGYPSLKTYILPVPFLHRSTVVRLTGWVLQSCQ